MKMVDYIGHFHSENNTAYYSVHAKLGMALLLYLGRVEQEQFLATLQSMIE